jgi:hypothetical protein
VLLRESSPKKAADKVIVAGGAKNVEKLKGMVQSLLHTTQLLNKDRSELYSILLQVLQGGQVSQKVFSKRFGLEDELVEVYNKIVSASYTGSSGENAEDLAIMSRPYSFVIYTFFVWIFGILMAILAYEYIIWSDFSFRFPSSSAIY